MLRARLWAVDGCQASQHAARKSWPCLASAAQVATATAPLLTAPRAPLRPPSPPCADFVESTFASRYTAKPIAKNKLPQACCRGSIVMPCRARWYKAGHPRDA